METTPPAIAPVTPATQTVSQAAPRAPALRLTALGRKALKWPHVIITVDGEAYLVRAPSVAAQRKILACMPEQMMRGTPDSETETLKGGELTVSVRPEVILDMKIERVIQCTHDLHGQRLFSDDDREELRQLSAEDEFLNAVSAAVDALTKKETAAGKPSSATPTG